MNHQPTEHKRRIACNELLTSMGLLTTPCVLELSAEGWVERQYPLTEELPHTEWLTGRITLSPTADGHTEAFYRGRRLDG